MDSKNPAPQAARLQYAQAMFNQSYSGREEMRR